MFATPCEYRPIRLSLRNAGRAEKETFEARRHFDARKYRKEWIIEQKIVLRQTDLLVYGCKDRSCAGNPVLETTTSALEVEGAIHQLTLAHQW